MFLNLRNGRWLAAGVIAVLGMFAAVAAAVNQPLEGRGRSGRMMRGPGGPGGMGLPLGRLDLSEDQRAQVRNVMEQNQAALREAEGRVRAARGALSEAVNADVFNEGAIRAVANELGLAVVLHDVRGLGDSGRHGAAERGEDVVAHFSVGQQHSQ